MFANFQTYIKGIIMVQTPYFSFVFCPWDSYIFEKVFVDYSSSWLYSLLFCEYATYVISHFTTKKNEHSEVTATFEYYAGMEIFWALYRVLLMLRCSGYRQRGLKRSCKVFFFFFFKYKEGMHRLWCGTAEFADYRQNCVGTNEISAIKWFFHCSPTSYFLSKTTSLGGVNIW